VGARELFPSITKVLLGSECGEERRRAGKSRSTRKLRFMKPVIRLAAAPDCEQISAVYAPYVLNTAISFETEPPGPEEVRRRVSDTLEFLPWLVCEQSGQVLGYSYADRYRARAAYQWSASVSVHVDSQCIVRASGAPCTLLSSESSTYRDCTSCMWVSRCRTKPAWDYISLVVFIRSAWSARSVMNSVHGMT